MSDNYKKILSFLNEHAGEKYSKPERFNETSYEYCKSLSIKAEAKKIVKLYCDVVSSISAEIGLNAEKVNKQWQNSGSIKCYFWTKLKESKYANSDISVSVFAEKINDKCQFRIAVEINDDAKKEDWEKYNKLVDIPLEKGLVYTIRDNRNKNTFKIFDKIDNKEAKKEQDKGYKMQVAYIIDNPVDDDDLIEKLKYYSKVLVKYYNYILTGEEFLVEGYPSKEEQIEEIEKDTSTLSGIERETLVKARVNQGVFRDKLLVKYKSKCCLCEVNNECLLVASHIKPWAKSEANEKLDDANGLLLCPNHDKLFDLGFISFDDDGNILISDELSSDSRTYTNVRSGMQIDITKVKKEYLAYHRDKVFKNI